jgi:creatinine amidohydrolase
VSERFIERMTWPEVEAAIEQGVDTVLIPIGTTEQHGHHMPLDTDCVIARSLCARVAEAAEAEGLSVIVAPAVNASLSWYHMQFPGEHPALDDHVLPRGGTSRATSSPRSRDR